MRAGERERTRLQEVSSTNLAGAIVVTYAHASDDLGAFALGVRQRFAARAEMSYIEVVALALLATSISSAGSSSSSSACIHSSLSFIKPRTAVILITQPVDQPAGKATDRRSSTVRGTPRKCASRWRVHRDPCSHCASLHSNTHVTFRKTRHFLPSGERASRRGLFAGGYI